MRSGNRRVLLAAGMSGVRRDMVRRVREGVWGRELIHLRGGCQEPVFVRKNLQRLNLGQASPICADVPGAG